MVKAGGSGFLLKTVCFRQNQAMMLVIKSGETQRLVFEHDLRTRSSSICDEMVMGAGVAAIRLSR
jgi:hypothetical protein